MKPWRGGRLAGQPGISAPGEFRDRLRLDPLSSELSGELTIWLLWLEVGVDVGNKGRGGRAVEQVLLNQRRLFRSCNLGSPPTPNKLLPSFFQFLPEV